MVTVTDLDGASCAAIAATQVSLRADRGIIRFTVRYEESHPPATLTFEVSPWAEALEGIDASLPDGRTLSLKEDGWAEYQIKEGVLRFQILGKVGERIPSGTRIQLIDYYR